MNLVINIDSMDKISNEYINKNSLFKFTVSIEHGYLFKYLSYLSDIIYFTNKCKEISTIQGFIMDDDLFNDRLEVYINVDFNYGYNTISDINFMRYDELLLPSDITIYEKIFNNLISDIDSNKMNIGVSRVKDVSTLIFSNQTSSDLDKLQSYKITFDKDRIPISEDKVILYLNDKYLLVNAVYLSTGTEFRLYITCEYNEIRIYSDSDLSIYAAKLITYDIILYLSNTI